MSEQIENLRSSADTVSKYGRTQTYWAVTLNLINAHAANSVDMVTTQAVSLTTTMLGVCGALNIVDSLRMRRKAHQLEQIEQNPVEYFTKRAEYYRGKLSLLGIVALAEVSPLMEPRIQEDIPHIPTPLYAGAMVATALMAMRDGGRLQQTQATLRELQ